MRYELYIDGKKVDVGSDTSFTLNYKSNLLTDLSKIVSNNSYTVKLPKTANNLRIIEASMIPSCFTMFPYRSHSARLLKDGIEIITDAMAVLMSVGESIEIALTWGNVKSFSDIIDEGKSLRELSSLGYTLWWNTISPGMKFPKIDYGYNSTEENVWYHPVVTVSELMNHIASDYGLVFEFEYYMISRMGSLVIPLLEKNCSPEESEACSVVLTPKDMGPEYSDLENSKRILFYRNTVSNYFFSTLGGTGTGGEYNYGLVNNFVNAKYTVTWELECTISGTIPENLSLIVVNGSVELLSTSTTSINGSTVLFLMDGTTDLIGKFGNVDGTIEFVISGLTEENSVTGLSGDVKIVPETEVSAHVEEGYDNRYYYTPNLPDIKVLDFMKSVLSMLGMFAVPVSDNKIKFVSFDTLIANKSIANDWSDKVLLSSGFHTPEEITYTLDNFARKNWFRYKEDDTVQGNYDNMITVDNETLESELEIIELPFAASDTNGLVTIPLYSYDSDGKLVMNSVEPRILYRTGVDSVSFKDISWDNLLSKYYSSYQDIVRNPKVIVETVRLNAVELKLLDLTIPVYLSQYGSYFAVISVKTMDYDWCEVKLLKI
ncbi:hypothetical protein [Phocaeicola barnesiae]